MSESAEQACVFCQILSGAISASIVYEGREVVAFLDPRQVHGGHLLVVPKLHVETLFDLDLMTGASLMAAMIELATALRKTIPADGLSVWQSNGPGAHQEVPHVHFHLMPRLRDDGLLRIYPTRIETARREDLDQQADVIRAALSGVQSQ